MICLYCTRYTNTSFIYTTYNTHTHTCTHRHIENTACTHWECSVYEWDERWNVNVSYIKHIYTNKQAWVSDKWMSDSMNEWMKRTKKRKGIGSDAVFLLIINIMCILWKRMSVGSLTVWLVCVVNDVHV